MVNPPLKSKLCLSSLLRWRISSCIWDLESPALTRLRTWSMVLFLRAMVLLQALEVGVVALKTLTKCLCTFPEVGGGMDMVLPSGLLESILRMKPLAIFSSLSEGDDEAFQYTHHHIWCWSNGGRAKRVTLVAAGARWLCGCFHPLMAAARAHYGTTVQLYWLAQDIAADWAFYILPW